MTTANFPNAGSAIESAAAALIASSALAVVVGAHIGRWIALDHLRIMAGLGFVAIGVWVLLT